MKLPTPEAFTVTDISGYLECDRVEIEKAIYDIKSLRLAIRTASTEEFRSRSLSCHSTETDEASWLYEEVNGSEPSVEPLRRKDLDVLETFDELDPYGLAGDVAEHLPPHWVTPVPTYLYVDLASASVVYKDRLLPINSGRPVPEQTIVTSKFQTFFGDEIVVTDGRPVEVRISEPLVTVEEWNRFVTHNRTSSDAQQSNLHTNVLGLLSLFLIDALKDRFRLFMKSGTKLSVSKLAGQIVESPKVTGVGETKVVEHIKSGLKSIGRSDIL